MSQRTAPAPRPGPRRSQQQRHQQQQQQNPSPGDGGGGGTTSPASGRQEQQQQQESQQQSTPDSGHSGHRAAGAPRRDAPPSRPPLHDHRPPPHLNLNLSQTRGGNPAMPNILNPEIGPLPPLPPRPLESPTDLSPGGFGLGLGHHHYEYLQQQQQQQQQQQRQYPFPVTSGTAAVPGSLPSPIGSTVSGSIQQQQQQQQQQQHGNPGNAPSLPPPLRLGTSPSLSRAPSLTGGQPSPRGVGGVGVGGAESTSSSPRVSHHPFAPSPTAQKRPFPGDPPLSLPAGEHQHPRSLSQPTLIPRPISMIQESSPSSRPPSRQGGEMMMAAASASASAGPRPIPTTAFPSQMQFPPQSILAPAGPSPVPDQRQWAPSRNRSTAMSLSPLHHHHQDSEEMWMIGTGGERIPVHLDRQKASIEANLKRERNAGASARFRQRKKEKDMQTTARLQQLEEERREADRAIRALTEQRDFYRAERNRLHDVVAGTPGIEKQAKGPPSPAPAAVRRGSGGGGGDPFMDHSPMMDHHQLGLPPHHHHHHHQQAYHQFQHQSQQQQQHYEQQQQQQLAQGYLSSDNSSSERPTRRRRTGSNPEFSTPVYGPPTTPTMSLPPMQGGPPPSLYSGMAVPRSPVGSSGMAGPERLPPPFRALASPGGGGSAAGGNLEGGYPQTPSGQQQQQPPPPFPPLTKTTPELGWATAARTGGPP